MVETLNRAIERYNAGARFEALRLASQVPAALRLDPEVCRTLEAIGSGVIADALAAEAGGEAMDEALEAAGAIVPPAVARASWCRAAGERLNRSDAMAALQAACFALDADPADLTARALFAECAARMGAADIAGPVAETLLPRAVGTGLADRLNQLIEDSRASRLDDDQISQQAVQWHTEGDAWRATSPARALCSKVMAASGALPLWQAVLDIGLMMAARDQADLALAFYDRVARHVRRGGIAEHAHDQLLSKLGRFQEKYVRRARVMAQHVAALVPPGAFADGVSWVVAADRPDALGATLAALRAHGFAHLCQVIAPETIARVSATVFAADPTRRFVDPSRDIPAQLRAQLVAPVLREVITTLGLAGPDAATSHGRQVFPGPEADQDSLTIAYHQDALAFYQPLLNLWIPLDPCGEAAPGLALLSDYTRAILPGWHGREKPTDSGAIDPDVAARLIRDQGEIIPTLQVGDALLFLGTVPHRTYLTPMMTKPRRSLELRFAPADWLIQPMPSEDGVR